ncbi:MAG: nucleotide sugar dehydrogenase [Candidatus Paceibacterota bacterium]|jgi:UDP-N-acetyl-D-glucosamine dehydrogenase
MANTLLQNIKNKKATVAVVGLGYVGIPTILALVDAGIKVIGIDVNKERIKQLKAGRSFIKEISDEKIKNSLKRFTPTTKWGEISKARVILIAVPTPLDKNKAPDTSFIKLASENIAKYLKRDSLVVLESTTYPGTTEEIVLPILEKSGLKSKKDFYLAFAPERVDPGNKKYTLSDIPKVIGGIEKKSTEVAAAFYSTFLRSVHKVSSARTAEMTKLLENIFRLVNISLVNELKMISSKMDIDFWEVIEAAKTKPYGFMPFYPGPGVGGHCIPLDPFYLSWKAREYDFFTRFIDLAGEINDLMPHNVITTINWMLNKNKKSIKGSKILILGVAYKKDIDDPRESAAMPIILDLLRKGARVFYNDPHIAKINIKGKVFKSSPLTKSLVKSADCVVILTDHSVYDYRMIEKNAKLIVDTRHAIKKKSPKIFS